ncbi:MAG: preprotein translocase subunit SecE [Planctomycetia bacterium]|nr:preprotein translocase subunit SecE [Planctomycetia bacterium]
MFEGKKSAGGSPASSSFFQNLLMFGLYKRNQGRITRQVTFFAIAIGIGIGAWRFSDMWPRSDVALHMIVPSVVALAGAWLAYRLVNMTSFADFLIAVEAEMGKVSWPTRSELVRGSVVVLIMLVFLATLLYFFDVVWQIVFTKIFHLG